MKSKLKNNKGVTLIELLLSLGLLGLVISLSFNFLMSTIRLPDKAQDEYDIQHEMRMTFEKITRITRDASATFALHRENHDNLTEGWNYIIPSLDGTSIIEYIWNDSATPHRHDSTIIAEPQDGVTYSIVFDKLSEPYEDNLLQYSIMVDFNGTPKTLTSETEALNSLQVIDRGSTSQPANALAYRTDPRPTEVSDNKAAISFVLDESGSMAYKMNGNSIPWYESNEQSRIYKLKVEAKRLIQELSDNPNIFASIVPFSTTANGSYSMDPVRENDTANSVMIDKIDALSAGGGTNTGDGMRRGYHSIRQFNVDHDDWDINNFMVILVDGVTTYYSAHRVNYPGNNLSHFTFVTGSGNIDNSSLYYYNHTYNPGRYGGDGGSLDYWGTQYVNTIGSLISSYGNTTFTDREPMKVYVIGFSSRSADHGSLNDIAGSTGATAPGANNFYTAGDSAALEAIFDSIQKDINDSLWHIGGPN